MMAQATVTDTICKYLNRVAEVKEFQPTIERPQRGIVFSAVKTVQNGTAILSVEIVFSLTRTPNEWVLTKFEVKIEATRKGDTVNIQLLSGTEFMNHIRRRFAKDDEIQDPTREHFVIHDASDVQYLLSQYDRAAAAYYYLQLFYARPGSLD